jgi:hypothetical protein
MILRMLLLQMWNIDFEKLRRYYISYIQLLLNCFNPNFFLYPLTV